MENSIRDIFTFLKLSWGLENDNTLFKNWWLGAIYQILTVADINNDDLSKAQIVH